MKANKISIEEKFITELVAHPVFQTQVHKLIKRATPQSPSPCGETLPQLVEQISSLLSQSYKTAVDEESLTVFQTCSQLAKDIDNLKLRISACESAKTDVSFLDKEREEDMSMLSEVSAVQPQVKNQNTVKFAKESSFMASLLVEGNGKDIRQELEQKLKSSCEDIQKLEAKLTDKIKAVELSFNKKMENIFKTLSSVFQSINDMQSKHFIYQNKEIAMRQGQGQRGRMSEVGQKMVDSKLLPRQKDNHQKKERQPARRRSFLGFNY